MGLELRDRVLGVIGLGGIARATIELLRPFGMQPPRAYDPFADPATAARLGVQLVGLEELMRTADFVSIHCPLNTQTRGLIGTRELAWMKPSGYLINTARGGIVDEDALYAALGTPADRRRRDRLFRRGTGDRPPPLRQIGKRPAGAAQHRLDRRAVSRHRPGRLPLDARPLARAGGLTGS